MVAETTHGYLPKNNNRSVTSSLVFYLNTKRTEVICLKRFLLCSPYHPPLSFRGGEGTQQTAAIFSG